MLDDPPPQDHDFVEPVEVDATGHVDIPTSPASIDD